MLSWAFADRICRKYQAHMGLAAQVDFMLGSELCSRKEHTHRIRMIEVPSVSHAAWTYCRTGKSFKMLKRERRVGGVCQSDENHTYLSLKYRELMRWWPGMSVNIKYTVALFSALHVSVRKNKHATCTIFSAFCTKPNDPLCCKRPRQSLNINLFHSLSPFSASLSLSSGLVF